MLVLLLFNQPWGKTNKHTLSPVYLFRDREYALMGFQPVEERMIGFGGEAQ
jgi:hypothetical protein